MLASCSDSRWNEPGTEKRSVMVRISTQVADNVPTKADNTGELSINTLRIYAFYEGRPAGYHYQESPVRERFLMDILLYGVDPSTNCQPVDFYIIANEAAMVTEADVQALDRNTTEEQLQKFRFIALNTSNGVPMCVHERVELNMIDLGNMSGLDEEIKAGHETHNLLLQSLDFHLERPVAKLTFSALKKSAESPVIRSLVMLARGTRHYNYLMPQDLNFLKTLAPRMNDRPVLEENTLAVIDNTLAEGFREVASIYCSEVPFGSASWDVPNSDNSVILRMKYSMGEGTELRTADMYMPPINRNDWIQVNCTISGEGQIIVNYSVRDWDYEMTDDNGDGEEDYIVFDYPTHTYFLPAMPTAENPEPDPDGSVKVLPQMSVSKPFVCYFQMLYPEGQTWKPTIISSDVAASDFDISVYMNDSDEAVTVDGEGGYGLNTEKSSYYRIEVTPLNAGNVGASLRLGITSEIQGFGHSEYLLINGSQAKLFWPSEGGSDPNALTITQIE